MSSTDEIKKQLLDLELRDDEMFNVNYFNPLASSYIIETIKEIKQSNPDKTGMDGLADIKKAIKQKEDPLSSKMYSFIEYIEKALNDHKAGDSYAGKILKNYGFI